MMPFLSRMNSLTMRPKTLLRLFAGQTTEWCCAMWKFCLTSMEMYDRAFTCALLLPVSRSLTWVTLSLTSLIFVLQALIKWTSFHLSLHWSIENPWNVCVRWTENKQKNVRARRRERSVFNTTFNEWISLQCILKHSFPYLFSLSNKSIDRDRTIDNLTLASHS